VAAVVEGGGGATPWSTGLPSQWQFAFGDRFDTLVDEGAMLRAAAITPEGSARTQTWGAETYLTTYGGQNGTGDYYGFNNISVSRALLGPMATACGCGSFPMRTGKRVGACPYPNISGTPGSSASASAQLYGRVEAASRRRRGALENGWLWWPTTWAVDERGRLS
jgi:hypothetical protein